MKFLWVAQNKKVQKYVNLAVNIDKPWISETIDRVTQCHELQSKKITFSIKMHSTKNWDSMVGGFQRGLIEKGEQRNM